MIRGRLSQEIKERFSKDELQELCFDLGINPEELNNKTISTLTESLLLYTEKHGSIANLIKLFEKVRPQVNWSELAFSDAGCPYRGLLPFREEDANLFFGRDTYIERLLEAVQKHPMVAVIGPSGSGKSSVVFAGLVPRLRQTGQWQIVDCRPSKEPFTALAGALIPLLEPGLSKTNQLREMNQLSADLTQGNTSLPQVMELIAESMPEKQQLLLIIDQFEELYTHTNDPADQQHFLDALLSLEESESMTLLITMRADFLGRALLYRPIADELQAATQMIGPMNRDEMLEVIERPLSGTFVTFEPGLTTQILDDVGQEPGNLPLLEFALTSLWDEQEEGSLTFAAYEKIGKVEGALTEHADEAYNTYADEEEAKQVRRLFVQLVQPVTGSVNTKRKSRRSELGDDLWQLTASLADDRLVVTGQDESGEETVELAHEALITHWQRFDGWIQEDWEFRAWQERLRANLRQWQNHDEDPGFLLLGAPLAVAEEWLEQKRIDLSQAEISFIEDSTEAEHQRQAEEAARQRRELEQAQALAVAERKRAEEQAESATKLRNRAFFLMGALGIAIVLAIVAFVSYQDSQRNEQAAIESEGTAVAESTRAFINEENALHSEGTAVAEATNARTV